MPSISTPAAAVTDFDDQRVQVDHRMMRLQRAALPFHDSIEDRVSDLRDRLVGQLRADR
jgi:hypothetical protein